MEEINLQETKKYTFAKRRGNVGAAHLEMVLSMFSLVNRIDEAKDIGIDFICEYTENDIPTGVLFAVQCRTRLEEPRDPSPATLGYWASFYIPIYEFWLKPKEGKSETGEYDIFYKRWTPQIHSPKKDEKFEPFADNAEKNLTRQQIFTNNLFYDYLRCGYRQGAFPYANIGHFPLDVMKEHEKELRRQGWAMPFAQGIIRENSEMIEELEIAKSSFELSLALWSSALGNNELWRKSIETHLSEVSKKIAINKTQIKE